MTDGGYWSARSFSQAEMPFGFALRLYDAFSAAVQRKCTCSVALSFMGFGGLPRRLGVLSITSIMPTQIIIDKVNYEVYSVYTLKPHTRRQQMNLTQKTTAELHYIIKDAGEAAKNMRAMGSSEECKYLDQVNDAMTELGRRMRKAA